MKKILQLITIIIAPIIMLFSDFFSEHLYLMWILVAISVLSLIGVFYFSYKEDEKNFKSKYKWSIFIGVIAILSVIVTYFYQDYKINKHIEEYQKEQSLQN